jgi:hypothetical protein
MTVTCHAKERNSNNTEIKKSDLSPKLDKIRASKFITFLIHVKAHV